jgi:hypothetical protein
MTKTIRLGFEVGTGRPVDVPLAHTFVTGQTQLSGKTTTLRAIVARSGRRALAFVTKRGEDFDGRRIRPYLPREGDKQIPWRLVETVMAASLGQRNMKFERGAIVNASKGATTLAGVRANVARLREKTKNGKTEELYMLLGEYLDLILPEMARLDSDDRLVLEPGVNVIDLAGVGTQTQAMVIRAALEYVNAHERDVLVVFPEAWEFAPRSKSAPAKDEAIAMARKGAVLGNFLLCDSQDLSGVDTVIRQASSVYILGVQRELNELKRTLDTIPAGIRRPKSQDVATLKLGQFFACWGDHAIKTYVQPAWMPDAVAEEHARSGRQFSESLTRPGVADRVARLIETSTPKKEQTVNETEAASLRAHVARLTDSLDRYRRAYEDLCVRFGVTLTVESAGGGREPNPPPAPRDERSDRPDGAGVSASAARPGTAGSGAVLGLDFEATYAAIKRRLVDDAPAILKVLTIAPELVVSVERKTLTADGKSLRGRIALMIRAGFFTEARPQSETKKELERTGPSVHSANLMRALDALVGDGFLTDEWRSYRAVAGMTITVDEAR